MKPFDVELAKAGHKVETREGLPVRILAFDFNNSMYPITAAVDYGKYEEVITYNIHGRRYFIGRDETDLMMADES